MNRKKLIDFLILFFVIVFLAYFFLPPHLRTPKPSSLSFTIYNRDNNEHRVRVVVDSVLNETYIIPPMKGNGPGSKPGIVSGSISTPKDKYTFNVTLDDVITREYLAIIDSRHGGIIISINKYPERGIDFGISQSVSD